MPSPVEGLLEVYEHMVEVSLVLEILLTEDSLVKDLLCGDVVLLPALKPTYSSVMIFSLWFQSVQYDIQSDFAWVTDEADRSVVLALLQVAFLGKCND